MVQFGNNGAYAGCTLAVIRVYPPATASLNTDLLELSGAFSFLGNLNGQAVFALTAVMPGNTGRVIQCGGVRPTITPGKPYSLVTFPSNIALCWTGGAGQINGLFLATLPFQLLGLTA